MSTATLVRQSDGSAHLYTPYDKAFVDALKARMPAALRRWNKPGKYWTIEGAGIVMAVAIVLKFYDDIEDIPAVHIRSTVIAVSPHAALHLTEDAPLGLVETAYRWLAMEHHPDRGGSTRAMQEINAAFGAIRKAAQR